MLLTDHDCITIDDLKARQADVITDAAAQNPPIELSDKISEATRRTSIRLHQQAVGIGSYGVRATDRLILWQAGDYTQFRFSNQRVVIDDSVQAYIESQSLQMFYEEAAGRVNAPDRYGMRRDRYDLVAKTDWNNLCSIGIPIVNKPLPRPDEPDLSSVSGGALAQRIYYVVINWQNSDPSSTFLDHYSAPSTSISIQVPANELLVVDISALSPPTGQTIVMAGTAATLDVATYWNVYVGTEEGTEVFQAHVPIGTPTWTEDSAGAASTGDTYVEGQEANIRILTARRWMRA